MNLLDVWNRVKNIFGTGITTRVQTGMVQLRLATGITNDKIKRVHNYGFMSRPLTKSKAYTLFIGGDTSRGIAVCIEDERYQMDLQPGEVAMLDDKGNLVHFTDQGIKVKTPFTVDIQATQNVNVTCQNATVDATKTTINSETVINGKTTINDDLEVTGKGTIAGVCAVGGLAAVGGGAVPAEGGMDMINGDITVDGISTKNHNHNDSLGNPTSPPLP
ncbi:MAG: baseplate assembly protein [Thiomicrospira sp.]|nr:MAG: baseplate assembly protein [Thiomicrospira sp.]